MVEWVVIRGFRQKRDARKRSRCGASGDSQKQPLPNVLASPRSRLARMSIRTLKRCRTLSGPTRGFAHA